MKERDLLNWVIEVAERTGWKVWHVPAPMVASRKGGFVPSSRGAGLPDLIMIHEDPPKLIFAEVKGEGGSPTIKQLEFLRLARGVSDVTIDSMSPALISALDLGPEAVGTVIPREQLIAIGVYLWSPGDEEQIEDILKSRVLA